MKLYLKIALLITILNGCSTNKEINKVQIGEANNLNHTNIESRTIIGAISGKTINLPNVNSSTASIDANRFVKNGMPVPEFKLNNSKGFSDVLSFNRKFGLLIPATNTTMEHELWNIIFNNQEAGALAGVGVHATSIQLPKISVQTEADLNNFKDAFVAGLDEAVDQALLSKPNYLIMGMSLEHILYGLDEIKGLMNNIKSDISWATWREASDAALKKYKAKRIGIISPFSKKGNENAIKMFEDMGYEVFISFGLACPDLVHIAHISDSAKEEVIVNYMATPKNRLDAILQLGTNMGMLCISL